MKVLMVCPDPVQTGRESPYVGSLVGGLRAKGVQVEYGLEKFLSRCHEYQVIHFHWPEAVFGWRRQQISHADVIAVRNQIRYARSLGIRTCYTRHNLHSHYLKLPNLDDLHLVLEAECDTVIHLGGFSVREYLSKHDFPLVRHRVIPHQLYPTVDRSISREEARRRLGLGLDDKVLLAFGTLRAREEQDLIVSGYRAACEKIPSLRLLAPQLPAEHGFGKGGRVPDEELPLYFAAADVELIPRKEILNSGNLPMAFYFGRTVVGPAVGNVGEILTETGNVTFASFEPETVGAAIVQAFAAAEKGLGGQNREHADRLWNLDRVAGLTVDVYREELDEAARNDVRSYAWSRTDGVKTRVTAPEDGTLPPNRVLIGGRLEIEQGRMVHWNWGDDLNLYLMKALTPLPVEIAACASDVQPSEHPLFFIGSGSSMADENSIVWGQGTLYENKVLSRRPYRICAVRGPFTRDKYLSIGADCPEVYGDPALLLPLVYRPEVKPRHRIGIAVHFREWDLPHIRRFREGHPEILMINMGDYAEWTEIPDLICSCGMLVTSSLHALITADAYGVPNVFVKFSDLVKGGTWKFRDYFGGVGRGYEEPLNFRQEISLAEAEAAAKRYHPIRFDAQRFLAAAPVPVEPRRLPTTGRKPSVSVVIPMYNAAGYIGRCLDSVLAAFVRYGGPGEVICVDDGSTDESFAVVESLIGKFVACGVGLKTLRQENGGGGRARNVGLAIARGDYLCFCDADDRVEPGLLAHLVSAACKTDAEVTLCEWRHSHEGGVSTACHRLRSLRDVIKSDRDWMEPTEAAECLFSLSGYEPWAKLFRKSFVDGLGLRFQEIRRTNDLYFSCIALAHARRIGLVDVALYEYCRNSGPVTGNDKLADCFCEAFAAVHDRLRRDGLFDRFKDAFSVSLIRSFRYNLNSIFSGEVLERMYPKIRERLLPLLPDEFPESRFVDDEEKFFFASLRGSESPLGMVLYDKRRLTDELFATRAMWNQVLEERENYRRELADSQKRRAELWRKLEEGKKTVAKLKAELADSQKRRGELWHELETAKKDRSEARAQLAVSQKRRGELWHELETAKKDRSKARAQFAESQKRRGELWKEREGYRKQFEEGEKRFKELAAEKQHLRNILRSVMDVRVCEEGK